MKKIILLFTLAVLGFSASAQTCPDPVNFTFSFNKINGILQSTLSWSGPIDTFYVEYGPSGFALGTGQNNTGTTGQINGVAYNVIDTTVTISPTLSNYTCPLISFYIYRVCSSGTSDTLVLTYLIPNSINNPIGRGQGFLMHNFEHPCVLDTPTTSTGKGFQFGNEVTNPPSYGASNVFDPNSKYVNYPYSFNKYMYARGAGLVDSAMRIPCPYFEFSQSTDHAYGMFYSNNTTNPGDNVTFTVDIETDLGYYPNAFSYSGDHNNWQTFDIPLAAYYLPNVTVVRMIIKIDQSTSLQPIYNDLLFSRVNVFELLAWPAQFPTITITQPVAGTAQISRPSKLIQQSTYQWGPIGFTPHNGQQLGDTVVFLEDSILLTALPPQAQWLYFKDTVQPFLFSYPKWYGPFNLSGASTDYAVFGKYFIDRDTNCVYSAKDVPLRWTTVKYNIDSTSQNGQHRIYYGHLSGQYYEKLQPNHKYRVFTQDSTRANGHNYGTCTPGAYYFNTYSPISFEANFIEDPSILPNIYFPYSLWNPPTLQGETRKVPISFFNSDAASHDSVRLELIVYNPSCLDSLFWNNATQIANTPLPIYEKWYYNMDGAKYDTLIVKSKLDTACLGTILDFGLTIDPLPNEQQLSDNIAGTWLRIVSAIDPNDKQVIPAEKTTLTSVDTLLYQIRFQNTGNYPAQNVTVIDTLPSFFANAEFILEYTSHDVFVSKDTNNIVTFNFNNIQLPDSIHDEENSHGFINYKIVLQQPMALHDSVANRAHIFFDYQPAVITNYAWTKIVAPSNVGIDEMQIGFSAYPNPAQDKLKINANQSGNYQIKLLDLSGRILISQKFDGYQTMLDVAHLVNGSYILHITGQGQKARGVQKINILR